MSNSFWPHGLYSTWNSLGQNTGVGSISLLQGIFPTQGSNPGLLHYRWILYQLSYKGSPRILEWVAYPFSSEPSWPRNQTGVSWIAGGKCGRPGFDPWIGKIPWLRERLPTPVFWPGEFHGLHSPCGCKESDTTERLSLSTPLRFFTNQVFKNLSYVTCIKHIFYIH